MEWVVAAGFLERLDIGFTAPGTANSREANHDDCVSKSGEGQASVDSPAHAHIRVEKSKVQGEDGGLDNNNERKVEDRHDEDVLKTDVSIGLICGMIGQIWKGLP